MGIGGPSRVLPPPLTHESQTRRGKDNPSMFVTPTARARCTSATTNSREYVIVDDVAALVHANRRDWNPRSCRMSRKRHAVQRLRKLHRSFGAGPRQGLSCDHDRWTNASLRAEFTLRVKCSVSRALDGQRKLRRPHSQSGDSRRRLVVSVRLRGTGCRCEAGPLIKF